MIRGRNLIVVLTIGVLMGVGMLLSCEGEHSDKEKIERMERVNQLDSLVRVQMDKNPEEALTYLDSLEKSETISLPLLSYFRAIVYSGIGQRNTAMLYFQKALEGDELQQESPESYYRASDFLATYLSNHGKNAEALDVANKCYEVARQDESPMGRRWTAILLHSMGYFHTQLGMNEEATRNFSMSYMALSQIVDADSSHTNLQTYARVSMNILDAYTTTEQYDEAVKWVSSAEKAANRLEASPQCTEDDRARYVGGIFLKEALIMTKLNATPSADEAYRKAQEVGYFNTPYGLLEQVHFLRAAERWDEMVAVMPQVDSVAMAWKVPTSLYFLKEYMAPRFTAYLKSGRKEQALELAESLMMSVDSLAAHEQNHEMQEITVIAKQKDKNTEAAKQEAAEAYRWVKILSIVLSILIVCILLASVYLLVKSRRMKSNK